MSSRSNNTTASAVTPPTPTPSTEETTPEASVDETNAPVDWSYDPNEPRYCHCNQVSYGNMVGCDNPNVSVLLIVCGVESYMMLLNHGSLQCSFTFVYLHFPIQNMSIVSGSLINLPANV